MAILKCKMCGGNLEANEKLTVATCEYCGSTMTLPKDADEKKANLFNRANHYRRNNDFDKAMATYENILNEDANDAEAHWGVVLCKYGIEYVEEPKSGKRVPTVHRAQYGSILADPEYKLAIANADVDAKSIYEQEAKGIESIQKQILEISAKEEPFDVFICYKETSESGSRTKDSVLAQDIYYNLTEAGFKVFFSRITLEDKLGSAYEPYIFAALNSSKVMVVVGTRAEHFNATWTKNEWSRYLGLIKSGAKKVLIPAYRDIDPYDLPEEFSHLQAQDMSKIGFIQDLTRGIQKVLQTREETKSRNEQASAESSVSSPTVNSLYDRALLLLEDGDFKKADELLENMLNLEPRNAKAYIGKLLVEYNLRQVSDIGRLEKRIDDSANYQKILRFADEATKKEFESLPASIAANIKEKIYQNAINSLKHDVFFETEMGKAVDALFGLGDYKDSTEQVYAFAVRLVERNPDSLNAIKFAISILEKLGGYKDSIELIKQYGQQVHKVLNQQEKDRKRNTMIFVVGLIFVILIIILNSMFQKRQAAAETATYEAMANKIEYIVTGDGNSTVRSISKWGLGEYFDPIQDQPLPYKKTEFVIKKDIYESYMNINFAPIDINIPNLSCQLIINGIVVAEDHREHDGDVVDCSVSDVSQWLTK